MSPHTITLPLAFAAGLASVLSPCVLPLFPAYVAYLGGPGATGRTSGRVAAVVNAMAFAIGVAVVLIVCFYLLAGALEPVRRSVRPVAGVVVMGLGIYSSGLWRPAFLEREWRLLAATPRWRGPLGGFLIGIGFAAGWTPCIGPILGAMLGAAAIQGPSSGGLVLMLAYAGGLGLPFVALGAGIAPVATILRSAGRRRRWIDLSSSAVLVAMGIVLSTDQLATVTRLVAHLVPTGLSNPFGL